MLVTTYDQNAHFMVQDSKYNLIFQNAKNLNRKETGQNGQHDDYPTSASRPDCLLGRCKTSPTIALPVGASLEALYIPGGGFLVLHRSINVSILFEGMKRVEAQSQRRSVVGCGVLLSLGWRTSSASWATSLSHCLGYHV